MIPQRNDDLYGFRIYDLIREEDRLGIGRRRRIGPLGVRGHSRQRGCKGKRQACWSGGGGPGSPHDPPSDLATPRSGRSGCRPRCWSCPQPTRHRGHGPLRPFTSRSVALRLLRRTKAGPPQSAGNELVTCLPTPVCHSSVPHRPQSPSARHGGTGSHDPRSLLGGTARQVPNRYGVRARAT